MLMPAVIREAGHQDRGDLVLIWWWFGSKVLGVYFKTGLVPRPPGGPRWSSDSLLYLFHPEDEYAVRAEGCFFLIRRRAPTASDETTSMSALDAGPCDTR